MPLLAAAFKGSGSSSNRWPIVGSHVAAAVRTFQTLDEQGKVRAREAMKYFDIKKD